MEFHAPAQLGSTSIQSENQEEVEANDPTSVDLVLEYIFQLSSRAELGKYRLVSKRWYQRSLRFWLEKSPKISLSGDGNPSRPHRNIYTVPDFLKRAYPHHDANPDSDHHPITTYEAYGLQRYQKFRLICFISGDPCPLLKSFWSLAGEWITHLQLVYFVFTDVKLFRDVVLCKYTPVLEDLDIHITSSFLKDGVYIDENNYTPNGDCHDVEVNNALKSLRIRFMFQGWDTRLPITWTELLLHFPNLEDLTLGYVYLNWISEMERMFTAIKTIRTKYKNKLSSLATLDIANICEDYGIEELPTSVLDFFQAAKLQLSCLALDLGMNTLPEEIHKILDFQAKSIRRMYLYRDNPLENFQLPEMPLLEELCLTGHPLPSLDFLLQMKNLRFLSIGIDENLGYREKASLIASSCTHKEMSEMVFPLIKMFRCDYENNWASKDVQRLHRWMPNLIDLQLNVKNNKIFRRVCDLWPNLERLHILSCRIDDEGITGMASDENQGEFELPTNITHLQSLRSFKMTRSCEARHRKSKLTIQSVNYGFLKLSKLEKLEFPAAEEHMNLKMEEKLKKKIAKVKITYELRISTDPCTGESEDDSLESSSDEKGEE